MFDVIDDKPEGVACGVYTRSHKSWAGLCVINPGVILQEGFIK